MSYEVCRNVLGIQRDYLRSEITFLTTSGQMAGHILKNRKSTKSLKNRFWPKIQNLVEWPIVAGMMIYEAESLNGPYESHKKSRFTKCDRES